MIEGISIEIVKIMLKFFLKLACVFVLAGAFLYLIHFLGTYNFN